MVIGHEHQVWSVEIVVVQTLHEFFDQAESQTGEQAVKGVGHDKFSLDLAKKISLFSSIEKY